MTNLIRTIVDRVSMVHGSLIKDGTTEFQTKMDPDDISVDVIARKRLISEIDKAEEIFKCETCDFSTKHQRNLRIHKKRLKIALRTNDTFLQRILKGPYDIINYDSYRL